MLDLLIHLNSWAFLDIVHGVLRTVDIYSTGTLHVEWVGLSVMPVWRTSTTTSCAYLLTTMVESWLGGIAKMVGTYEHEHTNLQHRGEDTHLPFLGPNLRRPTSCNADEWLGFGGITKEGPCQCWRDSTTSWQRIAHFKGRRWGALWRT